MSTAPQEPMDTTNINFLDTGLPLMSDAPFKVADLSQEVGLMATLTLLVSSFFVYRGETAMEFGDRKKFQINYLISMIYGYVY